jgi:hypothetical protein
MGSRDPSQSVGPSNTSPLSVLEAELITSHINGLPFILNSGTTCHISPECSDFKMLKSIPPSPIKGFQGTSVSVIGMGTMELLLSSDRVLKLENVLFVPAATIRLISVVTLNCDHQYITFFDPDACYVATKDRSIIMQGVVSPTHNLYTLTIASPNAAPSQTSHYTARTPNVETWHHRLGHCNICTILDMARTNIAKGMPIDLSYTPPKCNCEDTARMPCLQSYYFFISFFYYKVCWVLHVLQLGKGWVAGVP